MSFSALEVLEPCVSNRAKAHKLDACPMMWSLINPSETVPQSGSHFISSRFSTCTASGRAGLVLSRFGEIIEFHPSELGLLPKLARPYQPNSL